MVMTWWARRAAAAVLLAALVAADGDKVDVKDEVRSRDEPVSAPAPTARRAEAWCLRLGLPEGRCGRQGR